MDRQVNGTASSEPEDIVVVHVERHGGPCLSCGSESVVRIRVWEEEGGLLFEVADTGAGFDVSHRGSGAGFVNMTDRLGAIGGHVRVESAPGRGTLTSRLTQSQRLRPKRLTTSGTSTRRSCPR